MEPATTMRAGAARQALLRKPVTLNAGVLLLTLGLALAGGFWAGERSPFGATHARVMTGTALVLNDVDWQTVFTHADGHTQIGLYPNTITWVDDDGTSGIGGTPPCLRKDSRRLAKVDGQVPVEIGWTWVARPNGSTHQHALWLRCL